MESFKLKIDKLEGQKNWVDWKFQVLILLKSKGMMSVVEGKVKPPQELDLTAKAEDVTKYDIELERYEKLEYGAQQIIVSSMTAPVRQLINMCHSSSEMWTKLCSVYEQKSEQRQDRLFNELFSVKTMNPADGVAKHISRLESIWIELQDETWKEDKVKLPDSLFVDRVLNTLPSDYFEFVNA